MYNIGKCAFIHVYFLSRHMLCKFPQLNLNQLNRTYILRYIDLAHDFVALF